ncbi:MAG TPA: hypothetical protein VJK07_00600 [Candidatus Nanoarchaeia archaeon]|nr:hypothetical protein [Candidatus Nanoarchaeia archaeon]
MTFKDPLMPDVPMVDGLRCEDHATYIVALESVGIQFQIQGFLDFWKAKGFSPLDRGYETQRFPAKHTALVRGPCKDKGAREQIVGVSTSFDPQSPINRSLRLWGSHRYDPETREIVPGRLQHLAYDVDPRKSMEEVCAELEARGTQFMTPILRYENQTGATLEQRFVACKVPYGPFAEIIRRGLGRHGEPFQGFNEEQIDVLYEHYDAYSGRLLEQ